jgi:serine/threonine-protein kinase
MTQNSKSAKLFNIQGYTLNSKLGEGGCAEIFSAIEHATGQLVVIKILHERNKGNKNEYKRLRKEGQLWLCLGEHENIVRTYRVGEIEGTPFLVQEYIDGCTLREILNGKGAWPDVGVLKLAKELCQALHFIHKGGVIPKDLKPDNIMFSKEGRIKIIDLGFAEKEKVFNLFPPKNLEGSPAYMAPELILSRKASQATDIYALGCTLYEVAAGTLPFGGLTNSKIIASQTKMDAPAVPLRSHNKLLSYATEALILKACEKNVKKRYGCVDEMLLDIRRHPRAELLHNTKLGVPRA